MGTSFSRKAGSLQENGGKPGTSQSIAERQATVSMKERRDQRLALTYDQADLTLVYLCQGRFEEMPWLWDKEGLKTEVPCS